MKRYSIAYLLKRQSAGFRKHPEYPKLIYYFTVSPLLKRLRIVRRCYRILNNATVPLRNMNVFYRTYKLPKDPFFPLFIEIKRSVIEAKRERRRKKDEWIREEMETLPKHILSSMESLKNLEKRISPSGTSPVWNKIFIPGTKKRVRELQGEDPVVWSTLFGAYAQELHKRYKTLGNTRDVQSIAELMPALSFLGFQISVGLDNLPAKAIVRERYREMSKKYHPDLGGDEKIFILLKHYRDILLDHSK